VLAVDALDFTLVGLVLVLVLLVAAIYLSRNYRVTRVKLGVFFEREREREESPPGTSEQETKILGPWPGEKKEE